MEFSSSVLLFFDIFRAGAFLSSCVFLVCCLASSVLVCGIVPGGFGSLSAVPLRPLQLWFFAFLSFLVECCFFVFSDAFLA